MKTKKLALSAVLCALGVVILCVGSLLGAMDLSVCAIAALLVVTARIEMGMKYAAAVFCATGVLGAILAPQKEIAIFYVAFFGYYPMLKSLLEQRRRLWELLGKLVLSLLCLALLWLFSDLLLVQDATTPSWYLPALLALAELTFWLYDYALTQLITFYMRRIRPKLPFRFDQ